MEKRKSIVEPKCRWIVQFKREVEAKGSRIPHPIKYELVVPERMRLLNQSAYEPNANLYLGLNSYRAHEETSMHIYRLKARWAVFYFNQRTSQMGSGRSTELSSGSSSMQSGTDGEWGSFVHELQSVLQASMIQFDMLQGPIPEDELKDVLAADALFLFIYLLHMATPPEEAFRWLREIPRESGHLLWNDIFLLENQIPLQILDRIAQDLFQNHRIFHEIQPRRLYNREIDLHAVLLGQPIQTASDFLLRELVFTAIKSSFKKVFLVHADFERDGYLRDIVENEVKVQRCDHLLDCLLQVICYRPLKAHG
ncbi:hypothetical protein Mapa_014468 [Marchantia paleacea]|nr:hypothetical protein Mapa_014468 [Marchantia paleacea]